MLFRKAAPIVSVQPVDRRQEEEKRPLVQPRGEKKTVFCRKLFRSVPVTHHEFVDEEQDEERPLIRTRGGENSHRTSKSKFLLGLYLSALESRPVYTKAATSFIVTAIGDMLGQNLEGAEFFDLRRIASFALCGGFFVGPFVHFWYAQLFRWGEYLKSLGFAKSRMKNTLLMVAIDQTIGAGMFFPPYFFVYEFFNSLVRGTPYDRTVPEVQMNTELWGVLTASWRIFPFANFISFLYVPQELRVLASNVISVFWNAYLSRRLNG